MTLWDRWRNKEIDFEDYCEQLRRSPCFRCLKLDSIDVAHVKSRGSGGPDVWWNVIPFCRACHSLQHAQGWSTVMTPWLYFALQNQGWEWGSGLLSKRLFHRSISGENTANE